MNRWLHSLRVGGLLAVLIVLLAGCSPALLREQAQRLVLRSPAVEAGTPPADPGNQILLQGTDGNLYIASPDGKERFALTTDASRLRAYGQPTWSPDGEHIAWNAITRDWCRPAGEPLRWPRAQGNRPALPAVLHLLEPERAAARLSFKLACRRRPSMALRLVDLDRATKLSKRSLPGSRSTFLGRLTGTGCWRISTARGSKCTT